MRRISIILLLLIGFLNANAQEQQTPILEPIFVVADIYFAYEVLETVDISGSEVDAFLDIKQTLQAFITEAKDQKKNLDDEIGVKIELPRAQNLLTFLNRAKFKGRLALQYKRLSDALVVASKNYGK